MGITPKNHYRNSDFNNQEITDVKNIQINEDAQSSNHAVRKSQTESISAQAAQDILVALSQDATNDTAFTSSSMVGFLSGKQDNMSIHPDSASYLEIVDGIKIRAKQLLIQSVIVDETNSTLSDYITNVSPDNQEGDVIILTQATDNQQRSWIKTGDSSQGVGGYTRLQTDYNIVSIRAMFSSGVYLSYDSANGQFGLVLGNNVGEVGAHTVPVDGTLFNVVNGSSVLQLMQNLETYISNVDTAATGGQATVNTRLTSLVGVSGNNLGTFNESLFSDNLSVKQILQESETLHKNATTDRTAIRGEFGSADTTLQNNINSETTRATNAENTLSTSLGAEVTNRTNADTTLQNNINSETTRATTSENALDGRLDIVEGGDATVGSIAKAEKDAKDYAGVIVGSEANTRGIADNALQLQIDAISSAFLYKGYIDSNGRVQHIDTLHANHNLLFENVSLSNGDFYKVNASLTITFSDNTTVEVEPGDGLLGITSKSSGNVTAADIHKTDNTESADILREGMLDNTTITKTAGIVKVVGDSIGRTQLSPDVETDIDNKVLKAGDTMTGALFIDKTVVGGTGYVGGYDYAAYIKQNSVDTASLTNTQRALLVENLIYTNGSGNPFDLDYANAVTAASHYKGSSNSMSLAIVGGNFEANVDNNSAAIYATGIYGLATSDQLGVNAGGTFVAQNAVTSNLGIFAFSDTAGASQNRAAYFALSTDAIDFDSYRVARVTNPLPVQDAAVIIDDYTGVKHAAYINGKVEIGGTSAKLIIPGASADNEAVNLGDVKAKEFEQTSVSVVAGGDVVINHQLGSNKINPILFLSDELVTSSFKIERTSVNSIKIYNNTASDVTGLEVYVTRLSI